MSLWFCRLSAWLAEKRKGLISIGWRWWLRLNWPRVRGNIEKRERASCASDWMYWWGGRKRRGGRCERRREPGVLGAWVGEVWHSSGQWATQPPTLPAAAASPLLVTAASTWPFPPLWPVHVSLSDSCLSGELQPYQHVLGSGGLWWLQLQPGAFSFGEVFSLNVRAFLAKIVCLSLSITNTT